MKKIFLFLLIFSFSFADFKNISFDDFLQILSYATKKNIIVSDSVDKKMQIYLPDSSFKDKKVAKKILFKTLKLNNFSYTNVDNYLFIYKSLENKESKKETIKKYFYKFKFLNKSDIEKIISFFSDVKFVYLDSINTIFFESDLKTKNDIFNFLKKIDIDKKQKSIKISIYITDLQKLKSIGNNLEKLSNIFPDSINLSRFISSFFSLSLNDSLVFSGDYKIAFNSFIDFLIKNNYSNIVQSPFLLLRDSEKSEFVSAKNIPYLQSTAKIEDNKISSQATYDYRDVGLKVSITPKIFNDFLYLDLDLSIENLLTMSSTPVTSKVQLKNKFKLKNDELLVLSGLFQEDIKNSSVKFPVLGDVPLLDKLFKYDSKKFIRYVLTIVIEVL